ncbi:MAG: M20/M25/M40 family metallo-hydrolase [Deltaproteobacteria bacterium]|nr:M20/M25/M40 family metallo-hydrolase [Deltaproteobacteria bacterium]
MHRSLVALLLVACSRPSPPPASPPVADSAPHAVAAVPVDAAPDAFFTPSCVDDGKPYDEQALRARLAHLASPELDGRAPGTDGDRAARAFIAERFRCLGLTPAGDDGFAQPLTANGAATANLVGYVPGTSSTDIIVVGAHHDHVGDKHLGANDNASGVVALLAVAQAVRQHGPARRAIAFVAFGGEEGGLLGSLHFVAHPPAALPLERVVQYINLDMVGSHKAQHGVAAFGAFPGFASTKHLVANQRKYPRTNVWLGGHSVRGDQVGFCKQRIPYVFFWTPDDRCYHETCDTADRIDYPRMVDIAALAGDLVLGLADDTADLAAARARTGCGRSM